MASREQHRGRLAAQVGAACPLVDVRVGVFGQNASVTFTPAAGATPAQAAAAQAVIDGFDWSDAAHDAWEADRVPERRDLRAAAAQAIADNNTFLAIANPTNAQNAAQIKRLTQQMNAVIRRLVQLD